jgi:hypothetical protein
MILMNDCQFCQSIASLERDGIMSKSASMLIAANCAFNRLNYSRLQKACRFSVLGVPHFFLAAF